MINQSFLNNYFATTWRERDRTIEQYHYSGLELISKIRKGELVLDVGCGSNPFRAHIPNLIGIDPAFPEADYQITLEEFCQAHPARKFNVAFCLGSINFGDQQDIERQIALVVRCLREQDSRIYWRCNPGIADHGNEECEQLNFYPWTPEEHIRLAAKFGFSIAELEWDNNNRLYAAWDSLKRSHSAIA